MPDVPKILHAIWLGTIPAQDALDNILAWKSANPDYEMNLWIDTSLYPQEPKPPKMSQAKKPEDKDSFELEVSKYKEALTKYQETIEKYKLLLDFCHENNILLRDIGKAHAPGRGYNYKAEGQKHDCFYDNRLVHDLMLNKSYYDDEVVGTSRNFAAASDILRTEILYREGGVYFDIADVFPGKQALGILSPPKGFYCHCELDQNGRVNIINNDILATEPQGEILKIYRQEIAKQYQEYYTSGEQKVFAHRDVRFSAPDIHSGAHSRLKTTMHLSGPTLLRKVIENNIASENEVELLFPQKYYQLPKTQASSWFDSIAKPEVVADIARNYMKVYFRNTIYLEIDAIRTKGIGLFGKLSKKACSEIEQLEQLQKIILSPLPLNLLEIMQKCGQLEDKTAAGSSFKKIVNKLNAVANKFENQLIPHLQEHYGTTATLEGFRGLAFNDRSVANHFIDKVVLSPAEKLDEALQEVDFIPLKKTTNP